MLEVIKLKFLPYRFEKLYFTKTQSYAMQTLIL